MPSNDSSSYVGWLVPANEAAAMVATGFAKRDSDGALEISDVGAAFVQAFGRKHLMRIVAATLNCRGMS